MDDRAKSILLLKILISVAFLDGKVTPITRKYLSHIAKTSNLLYQKEIQFLLHGIIVIKPEECYSLVLSYLKKYPRREDYFVLLELIGLSIYSKDNISIAEANLLNKLQLLEPSSNLFTLFFQRMIKFLQKLYRSAIKL